MDLGESLKISDREGEYYQLGRLFWRKKYFIIKIIIKNYYYLKIIIFGYFGENVDAIFHILALFTA